MMMVRCSRQLTFQGSGFRVSCVRRSPKVVSSLPPPIPMHTDRFPLCVRSIFFARARAHTHACCHRPSASLSGVTALQYISKGRSNKHPELVDPLLAAGAVINAAVDNGANIHDHKFADDEDLER
jgi:hypothetical protein